MVHLSVTLYHVSVYDSHLFDWIWWYI